MELKGWLTGWKAIAKYVSRSVKTAKKYHTRYGMPVRRGPNNMPMVLPHELDRWLVLLDEKKKGITGYIYFIQADNGLIKIGHSIDPNNRLVNLQYASPLKVHILAFKPGTRQDEKNLHKRYKQYRKHGEWFEPGRRLVNYINRIKRLQGNKENRDT